MKKVILNLFAFVVVSLGLATAFYQVQAQGNQSTLSTSEHGTEGQAHSEVKTDQAAASTLAPLSPAERDPKRLWCREHGVYEDECTLCHPELAANKKAAVKKLESVERDPNRLWCGEHGVYEDECLLCHPELAIAKKSAGEERETEPRDPNRLWCKEHGIYEDECVLCHPELALRHTDPTQELICAEHNVPETQCGICQPQLAANLKPGESMKVRLASSESIGKAGVQAASAERSALASNQTFLCEVGFNQNRTAHISALTGGVIQKVYVELGDEIQEGQVLMELASTEMAKAKSEYLKALDQEELKRGIFQREKELVEKNISARQDFQQAEADYQMAKTETKAARQELGNLGFSAEEIATLEKQRQSSSVLKVRAPFSGTLVEKHAVLGEAVEPGETVLEIVDLSTMWLKLSIPESQMSWVQKGDEVIAEFDALPGALVKGKITWVSSRIQRDTRLLELRAEVANPEEQLKEGLFGQARLVEEVGDAQWVIPADSVQVIDGDPFVFVKKEADLYDLRRVEPGKASGNRVEILAGLELDDMVVTVNSFTLKSEFLKSRFGAGCIDD